MTMNKKMKYTRQLSRREANLRKAVQAAREASALEYARWQEEQLQLYACRARECTSAAERRALCLEVWDRRHSLPQAVSIVSRILKERDACPHA